MMELHMLQYNIVHRKIGKLKIRYRSIDLSEYRT